MGFRLALLPLLLGLAHAEPDPKDIQIHSLRGQVKQLERAQAVLQDENKALQDALALAETRLGLRPFRPTAIKPGNPDWRVKPGKVMRIDATGDKPRKDHLGKDAAAAPAYVLAYWATWCKPCTTPEEIAAMGKLRTDLKRLGRPLYGVAVDGLKKVRGHARAGEWFYPIWHQEDAHIDWLPEKFIKAVGLGLPLFVVVSGQGELLAWHNSTLEPKVHEELLTAAARARP